MQKLTDNFSKPRGFLGAVVLNRMNKHHDRLTRWALSFAEIKGGEAALDIGCGGGNAIAHMEKTGARVTGVDYSPLSVKQSLRRNKKAVREGRVAVEQADVAALPFPDGTFDKATAFETIYFWPDWPQNFGEVLRVLKPGGRFCAVYEMPHDPRMAEQYRQRVRGMRIPAPEEAQALLEGAGFRNVRVYRNRRKTWDDICVAGEKPVCVRNKKKMETQDL